MLPGDAVDGPFSAFAEAQIINDAREHAAEGKTYAQLGAEVKAAEAAGDTALAEELQGQRTTVMNASFLRASLFTSVIAYGVAALVMGLGVILALVGWAFTSVAKPAPVAAVTHRRARAGHRLTPPAGQKPSEDVFSRGLLAAWRPPGRPGGPLTCSLGGRAGRGPRCGPGRCTAGYRRLGRSTRCPTPPPSTATCTRPSTRSSTRPSPIPVTGLDVVVDGFDGPATIVLVVPIDFDHPDAEEIELVDEETKRVRGGEDLWGPLVPAAHAAQADDDPLGAFDDDFETDEDIDVAVANTAEEVDDDLEDDDGRY